MWNFYTVLLQIHSGNRLPKISLLDLSLIKLLQNEQGCNFLPHSVDLSAQVYELRVYVTSNEFDRYILKYALTFLSVIANCVRNHYFVSRRLFRECY